MESRKLLRMAMLAGCLVLVFLASIFLGRSPEPLWTDFSALWKDDLVHETVIDVRLPRLVMALLLGAALSGGGYILQMLLRNPLADPGLLGILPGAAFGAALAVSLSKFTPSLAWREVSAMLFAALGLTLSYWTARRIRIGEWSLRLLLSGILVSSLFLTGIGVLSYTIPPEAGMPGILFWLLGSLKNLGWRDVYYTTVWTMPPLVLLYLFRYRLNLLTLEEESAFALGSSPEHERFWLAALAIAAGAAVTAVAGIFFWVGLVFPFLARRLFGAEAHHSFLGAILAGALFVLVCDDLARVAFLLPEEIPLGIVTSLLAAMACGAMITNWKSRSRL